MDGTIASAGVGPFAVLDGESLSSDLRVAANLSAGFYTAFDPEVLERFWERSVGCISQNAFKLTRHRH